MERYSRNLWDTVALFTLTITPNPNPNPNPHPTPTLALTLPLPLPLPLQELRAVDVLLRVGQSASANPQLRLMC